MVALRAIVVVLSLPVLSLSASACVPMIGIAAAPAGAIGTTVASGKTPIDHVLSLVSGKDCSVRRNRQGLTYCVEDEQQPPVRVACYRTLGDVSCYDRPDPYHGRQRAIVEDLGVTLVPFVTGNPIPPGLLPGPWENTSPVGVGEYEVEPPERQPVPAGSAG